MDGGVSGASAAGHEQAWQAAALRRQAHAAPAAAQAHQQAHVGEVEHDGQEAGEPAGGKRVQSELLSGRPCASCPQPFQPPRGSRKSKPHHSLKEHWTLTYAAC